MCSDDVDRWVEEPRAILEERRLEAGRRKENACGVRQEIMKSAMPAERAMMSWGNKGGAVVVQG